MRLKAGEFRGKTRHGLPVAERRVTMALCRRSVPIYHYRRLAAVCESVPAARTMVALPGYMTILRLSVQKASERKSKDLSRSRACHFVLASPFQTYHQKRRIPSCAIHCCCFRWPLWVWLAAFR